jgi:uncharacterized protein DUF6913
MVLAKALSYKTKRFIKLNHGIRMSVPYADAKQIGIIFSNDTTDKSRIAEELKSLLLADNKQIKVLAYDRNVQVKHLPFESFSKKDVSFWGNFRNQSIEHFAEIPFDFLICLDTSPGDVIKNLLAKSKAKCRVGTCDDFENYNKLFELIIQNSKESNLVDSVYSYTKKIR